MLTIFLFFVILFCSIITRFYNLGETTHYVFDENFFIPIAKNYQNGEFFGDPHPPLGRLLITGSASIFSEVSIGYPDSETAENLTAYRLAPAFFGAMIPVVVFFIILLLTKSNIFAFIGAFLTTFDNALIVHARFALFDEILILFILTSLFFSLFYVLEVKSEKKNIFKTSNVVLRIIILILAGSFAGAALATKLTGLVAIAFLVICILYKTYKDRYKLNITTILFISLQLLISFIAIFGVFFISFKVHFDLIKSPGKNLEEFSEDFQNCFQGEGSECKLNLFELTNEQIQWSFNYESLVPEIDFCKEGEMGSTPAQWPFMGRAIPYSFSTHEGVPLKTVSYIYLTGNPVVWYPALLAIVVGVSMIVTSAFFLTSLIDKKVLFLVFTYMMCYIPYFFIERVMYFYHYFPALILSIILMSVLMQKFYNLHMKEKVPQVFSVLLTLIFLLLTTIGFLVYAPLTYNKKVNVNYVEKIILTDFWNLRVDPYNYNKQ